MFTSLHFLLKKQRCNCDFQNSNSAEDHSIIEQTFSRDVSKVHRAQESCLLEYLGVKIMGK